MRRNAPTLAETGVQVNAFTSPGAQRSVHAPMTQPLWGRDVALPFKARRLFHNPGCSILALAAAGGTDVTITLFIPCFVDLMFPAVGISMVRILERLGHRVVCPEPLACCGQPAFNAGYWDEARGVAANVMRHLRDAEVVVVASGSCGAMLRNFYPELFAGTGEASAAQALSARCHEFSDFLVNRLGVTDLGAHFPARVTFHDGCHGLRELGIKQAPRLLLANVRGLRLIEMAEAETCCGFGGTFAAKFPMISTAMAEVKCASASETGAEYIVSNDSSCLMQLQGLIRRRGQPLKTIHLAEILANHASGA
jgi:L-lactate dehydrogenase complex protein LldE